MNTGRTVIDLGVVERGAPPAVPAPPPLRIPVAVRAGAVLALLVLTLAAAAAPPLPWVVPILRVPVDPLQGLRFHLTEDTLYLLQRAGSASHLTAYRLADGSVRWQVPADEMYLADGIPVRWFVTEGGRPPESWLDPETGEELGTGDGVVLVTEEWVVATRLARQVATDLVGWPDRAQPPDVELVVTDRATGTELRRIGPVRSYTFDPVADAVVAHTGTGLVSYDLRTGAERARVPLAVPATSPLWPVAVGDLILVQPQQPGGTVLAYAAGTLEQLWTAEVDVDLWSASACGELLCVAGRGGSLLAFDPDTGTRVWSSPLAGFPVEGGPMLGGYLLAGASNADAAVDYTLVDARTGAEVLDLGRWEPAYLDDRSRPGWGGLLLARQDAVRATGADPQTGWVFARITLARLRLDPPRVEVLGTLDSGPAACEVGDGTIACLQDRHVQVWRVR